MIMGITEIVLLVLGIGVLVASFVIPEKKKKLREGERELGEAQIKELLEGQLEEVQEKVADAVEGAISYALEKAERSMERISNEKIMAINEYSDTVLESIHKNHEETVFLYDMLNDKYESLKSFASEVDKKAKEVKESARESVKVVEESARAVQASTKAVIQSELAEGDKKFQEVSDRVEDFPETKSFSLEEEEFSDGASADATVEEHVSVWPVEKSSSIKEEPEKKTERQEEKEEVMISPFIPLQPERIQGTAINDKKVEDEPAKGKTKKKTTKKHVKLSEVIQEKQEEIPTVNLSFANTAGDGKSNKEKILALYKEGKSNVAIAKELGLGIGEVKLIIDLFKGV